MSEPETGGHRPRLVAGRPVGLLVVSMAYAAGGLAALVLLPDSQADLSLRAAIAVLSVGVGLCLLSLTRAGWWVGVATTGLIGFVACAGVIWGLLLVLTAGPNSGVVEPLGVAAVAAAGTVWAYNYLWGTVRPLTR
jgi:hypothetical protein